MSRSWSRLRVVAGHAGGELAAVLKVEQHPRHQPRDLVGPLLRAERADASPGQVIDRGDAAFVVQFAHRPLFRAVKTTRRGTVAAVEEATRHTEATLRKAAKRRNPFRTRTSNCTSAIKRSQATSKWGRWACILKTGRSPMPTHAGMAPGRCKGCILPVAIFLFELASIAFFPDARSRSPRNRRVQHDSSSRWGRGSTGADGLLCETRSRPRRGTLPGVGCAAGG